MKHFYIIGALKNSFIPELEKIIRSKCPDVVPFAEWFGAGPDADDCFKEYHKGRGLSFREALESPAGRHIFEFDKRHLDRCDGAVLVFPAGRSCHLEAGYVVGRGKPVLALYPDGEPEDRYEIMMQFLTKIYYSTDELTEGLNEFSKSPDMVCNDSIRNRRDTVSLDERLASRRLLSRIDVC